MERHRVRAGVVLHFATLMMALMVMMAFAILVLVGADRILEVLIIRIPLSLLLRFPLFFQPSLFACSALSIVLSLLLRFPLFFQSLRE
jgi:hypothetical protein